ncbi:hypothetical protein [Cellulomonas terrae]|uniref:Uncharacterized protein n=1 Tax=Cellulomonas terrae TaxID=311234 RepID=A0A511JGH6_9CELL|nr:hypothetical protein [Cellulomonas terrae]GEL97101.1 hypothetical protein CTE05_06480 [Cellulomonas terrae]
MIGTSTCSELLSTRGASVATRYDRLLCARIDVRTEDGLHAAQAGARLVRQAVVAARAQGLRTAELTLDVGAPVTGAVLEQLRNLVDDVADVHVRRAGGTVLVEVELTPLLGRQRTQPSPRLGAA